MPPPNKIFSEPVIFHKIAQLYFTAHTRVLRFPKISRYSLGVRIENTVLEILELAYLAQSKKGPSRLLILNKADIILRMLFVHLRIAYKIKCLNDASFAELSEKCVEIGKMLGGWIKHTNARE
jgi:hypothetical protein